MNHRVFASSRKKLLMQGLVLAASCSLVLSLATRFWAAAPLQPKAASSIQAHSPDAGRQRLLNDGLHWTAPASVFVGFKPERRPARILFLVPPLIGVLAESWLHTRPPPLFSL